MSQSDRIRSYFQTRRGITPDVKPGINYDVREDTLTYMSPSNVADRAVSYIVDEYAGKKFMAFDLCGNIGGITIALLDSNAISYVITLEPNHERSVMLRRNINAYQLGQRSIVKEMSAADFDFKGYEGCAVYIDPPWLPLDVKGIESTKEQYVSDIQLGGFPMEWYLKKLKGIAYVVVFHLPPKHKDIGPVEGWEIRKENRTGFKQKSKAQKDGSVIVQAKKPVFFESGVESVQVVKSVYHICICKESWPFVISNYGGLGNKEFPKQELTSEWKEGEEKKLPTKLPIGQKKFPVPGKVVLPKPMSPIRETQPSPQLSTKVPIPKRLPIPSPPPAKVSSPVKLSPPPTKVSPVKQAVSRGNWQVFSENASKIRPSNSEPWIKSFQTYIYTVLSGFCPKENALQLVTQNHIMTWVKAFTHELADPTNNYESLEFIGDESLSYCFKRYLLIRDPKMTPQYLTEFKSQFLSKEYLAEWSIQIGFDKWVNIAGQPVSVGVCEDLFESFCGALVEIGNGIQRELGISLLYNFVELLFNDVQFDEEMGRGIPKTYMIQHTPWEKLPGDNKGGVLVSEFNDQTGYYCELKFGENAVAYMKAKHPQCQLTTQMRFGNAKPETKNLGNDQFITYSFKPSKKAAEYNAYDLALKYVRKCGLTYSEVEKSRKEREMKNFDPQLISKVLEKAGNEHKVVEIEIKEPKSIETPTNVTYLLRGILADGSLINLSVISGKPADKTVDKANVKLKTQLLQQYLLQEDV